MRKGLWTVTATLVSVSLLLPAAPRIALADPGTYAICSPSSFAVGSYTDVEWDYTEGHDTIITASGPSGTFIIDHQYYGASSRNVFVWNGKANGVQLATGTYTVTITPNDAESRYAKSTACTLLPASQPAPTPTPPSQPTAVPYSSSWDYPEDPEISNDEVVTWRTWDVDYDVMSPPSDFHLDQSQDGFSLSAGTSTFSVNSEGGIEGTIPTSGGGQSFKYGSSSTPIPNVWFGEDADMRIGSGTVFSGDINVTPQTHLGVNPSLLPDAEVVALIGLLGTIAWRLGPQAGPVLQVVWNFIKAVLPELGNAAAPSARFAVTRQFNGTEDAAIAVTRQIERSLSAADVTQSTAQVQPSTDAVTTQADLIDEVFGQGADQMFAPTELNAPATLYNGQTFQFSGSGYGPGDPVSVWFGPVSGVTAQTTVQADGQGQISGSFQVPQTAGDGTWYVFAVDHNQVVADVEDLLNGASDLKVPLGVGSFSVVKDTTPPAVSLDAMPGSPTGQQGWYDTPVTIGVSATDTQSGVDQVELSLDAGATWEPYTGPVTLTNGRYAVEAAATDFAGNRGTSSELMVPVDTIPPTTDALGVPTGWVNHAVQITLSAADNLSGVQNTYVSLDGMPPQEATALSITAEGYHTVTYWSEDNAGNVETSHHALVPIDLTPPVVQGTTNIAPNAKGWFRTDVTVQWSASDPPLIDGHPGSGVAEVSSPVTITQEGKDILVTGQATDNAGNVGTAQVSLNIDKTPPTITITEPQGVTYLDDQTITPSFSATDALSGVDTVAGSVYGLSAMNGQGIELWQLPLGPVPFTVTASDNAGNSASQTVTFTVTTNIGSMEDLIGQFTSTGLIADRGLGQSLTAKLREAESAQARGDQTASVNALGAFENELDAQTGKGVAATAATVLLRDAQYVLTSWEG